MIRTVAGALVVASISLCMTTVSRADTMATMSAGPKKSLGAGHVWSWVRKGSDGRVAAFGISFDDAALRNLGANDTEIPMPLTAAAPFRTATIGWNAHGHPPAHVYDVPHFDFHFYTIPESRRMAIAPAPPHTVATPKAAAVPKGYISDGAVVPMMGMHYVPATAPEFRGGRFTATPIYGYDQGHLAFVESMMTLTYLKTHPSLDKPLAQPASVPYTGAYPTRWGVHYDRAAHRYDVEFSTLLPRVAKV